MIPQFNLSGVLPPFSGLGPTDPAAMSPYKTELNEIFNRFANNPYRVPIFQGLLNYRRALKNVGITDGFQWIDGSYVENCEKNRGRSPNDVDIVTFAERPVSCTDNTTWNKFVAANSDLFNQAVSAKQYRCHANYEDLGLPSMIIASRARYWFGLFSHQRTTFLWKGILEINLQADDDIAQAMLNGGNRNVT